MIDFQDNRGAPLLALRHLLGSCSRLFLPLLVLLVTLRPDAAARAQLPAQVIADPPAVIEPLTVSALQDRRRLVDENTTLDAAARTALQETLAGAIRALQEEEAYLEQTRALQALTENAAAELEATRSKLEAPAAQPQMPSESDELSASQQKLTELEEQLRTAESLKSQLDQRDVLQSKRRTESPAELTRAKATLEALEKEPAADDAGLSPDVAFANAALRQARRRAVVAKIAFLERELPAYEATAALLAAQRSLAARRVTVARRAVGTWQEHVNRQRMSQAEANADEAGRLVQNASPQASALADEVLNLALKLVDVRSGLAIEIASTNRSISLVETETARLKTDFEQITTRAEAAGFTNSVGVLLRQHSTGLPDLRRLEREIANRQAKIADTHIQLINYKNDRSTVIDVEIPAERMAAELGGTLNESERQQLRDELRMLLQARGRYLEGVIGDLSSYLERLATLDARQRTLLQQSQQQAGYVAEHILWVRSTTALGMDLLKQTVAALTMLQADFAETEGRLADDVLQRPQLWVPAMAIVLMVLLARSRIREKIRLLGQTASRKTTTVLRPTLVAAGLTVLVSAAWPALLWFIGWRLSVVGISSRGAAAAYAFQATGLLVFTVDFLRHVCRPHGLGIDHFSWPPRSVDVIRRTVRVIVFVVVPLAGLSILMDRTQVEIYQSSPGRILLIAALITLAMTMHSALRPGSPVIEEAASREGWFSRTRFFWYAMGVGIPLVLSLLAATGYLYTARQLSFRLVETGWLLLSVVLAASLLHRWQLLTYRSLAMKQARERRAALLQEQEQAAAGEDTSLVVPVLEDELENLSESNVRLGKLLRVVFAGSIIAGLAMIWSDVLPAFGVLSQYELWQSNITTEIVDGVENYTQITLREVSLAIILLAVTFFSATNIPALLEFAILQRLPLDSGTRYAVSTVVRYLITMIGVAFSCFLLGFGWSNIQWLVAAMTVGLGFGLQEIFANFVSGLILLFERPIRIGDTVTVGEVTGTVTRIRIRATTIVDWDRKELVVPNREFVTGQLINWTLSDAVLRLTLQVGIAYGSDTRLATELLYRVAAEEPDVLEEPLPRVVFYCFGESSLDFELRCFVTSPQVYRVIRHDLNMAIDDLFRQHNIEIAFPQRDLHLRSMEVPVAIENVRQSSNGEKPVKRTT
ncbi:MAG: mechanosensitive ion channel [Fuerstiella sp.]